MDNGLFDVERIPSMEPAGYTTGCYVGKYLFILANGIDSKALSHVAVNVNAVAACHTIQILDFQKDIIMICQCNRCLNTRRRMDKIRLARIMVVIGM